MSLRLVLDCIPQQVSRRLCNVISQRLCSSEVFKSILSDSGVPSPFADPSKMRSRTGTEKNVAACSSTSLKEPDHICKIPLKESREAHRDLSSKTSESRGSNDNKLSAAEELRLLKEQLEKSQEHFDSGGSTKISDESLDDDAEKEKRRKRLERNTRIGGVIVLGSSVVGFVIFCLYYGRSKRDELGNVVPDEWTGSYLAPLYRIANSFKLWRDFVVEPAREKLLPDPLPHPYVQPRYTLVIEMKNILVHPDWTYKTGYRFAKRPALDYFLDVVGYPNFEVVIYTSESMMTAHPVVDSFDPKQRIMYRLYRDCTKYMHGKHVKDLSKLNRDLSKVIFIDVDPKAAQLNPENVLLVPEWKGNMDDTSLVDLAELLKTLHLSDVEDVRPTLQYYSQFPDPAKEFRRRAIYLAEQEQQKKQQMEEGSHSLLKKYSGRLFGYRRHAPT